MLTVNEPAPSVVMSPAALQMLYHRKFRSYYADAAERRVGERAGLQSLVNFTGTEGSATYDSISISAVLTPQKTKLNPWFVFMVPQHCAVPTE